MKMKESKKTPKFDTVLLKAPDVVKLTTLKRSLIYKLIREGKFPKQLKFGARRVAWRASEVDEFIAGKRDWT
jgi:prophage regulatory protein